MLQPRVTATFTSVLCVVALTAAVPTSEQPQNVPDFSGPWALTGNHLILRSPAAEPGLAPGEHIRRPSRPVGNYDSPLLKPWAATAVKNHGDILLAGKLAPDAHTACYPWDYPMFCRSATMSGLETAEWITIAYQNGSQHRIVHMNARTFAHPVPSWFGESSRPLRGRYARHRHHRDCGSRTILDRSTSALRTQTQCTSSNAIAWRKTAEPCVAILRWMIPAHSICRGMHRSLMVAGRHNPANMFAPRTPTTISMRTAIRFLYRRSRNFERTHQTRTRRCKLSNPAVRRATAVRYGLYPPRTDCARRRRTRA